MENKYLLFLDDFGTRTICKGATGLESPVNEFSFALGGALVAAEHVKTVAKRLDAFRARWGVPPLHGNKIRSGKGKFSFLKDDAGKKETFLAELEEIILCGQMIAHACVICRPGYRDRYLHKYAENNRWEMSKTAFDIVVERAAKLARYHGRKLDVVFERTGQKEDRLVMGYFESLKTAGLAFDPANSDKYSPLTNVHLSETLNSIWADTKSNPLLQLADLVVHPVAHITSGKPNRAHEMLVQKRLLMDFQHADEAIAVKYSCFDGHYCRWIDPKKHKGDPEGSPEAVGMKPDPVAKP